MVDIDRAVPLVSEKEKQWKHKIKGVGWEIFGNHANFGKIQDEKSSAEISNQSKNINLEVKYFIKSFIKYLFSPIFPISQNYFVYM